MKTDFVIQSLSMLRRSSDEKKISRTSSICGPPLEEGMVHFLCIKFVELVGKRGGLLSDLMTHNEGGDAA